MGRLFGTDGVRGAANSELTPKLAYELGRAGAFVLTEGHLPKILIGCDTRISADMLEAALTSGMCSVGAQVYTAGIIPTPAVAYLVRKYGFDAGVVISASHNQFSDNGIKFFNKDGYKLSDELEDKIESLINDGLDSIPSPIGEKIGFKVECEDALTDYVSFLKSTLDLDFEGLRIGLDCANGATYEVAPLVFFDLKAHVIAINNQPNGTNINENCGSTHMEAISELASEERFDVSFAFDGDGDRVLAVDENGETVDGDEIMTILGNHFKSTGKLKNNTIVATVMSNLGFFKMGEAQDINIVQTKVGDRYVLENMLQNGHNLGGEQSGHVILLDYNTTGDGLLTALQLVSVMKETKKPLSELKKLITVLPQVIVNAKVPNDKKKAALENDTVKAAITELEEKLKGNGRVLIRPSGTEPVIRVMLEGSDKDELTTDAQRIAKLLEEV